MAPRSFATAAGCVVFAVVGGDDVDVVDVVDVGARGLGACREGGKTVVGHVGGGAWVRAPGLARGGR
jgi:hypothetical protein